MIDWRKSMSSIKAGWNALKIWRTLDLKLIYIEIPCFKIGF